jgi:hypothetical protein
LLGSAILLALRVSAAEPDAVAPKQPDAAPRAQTISMLSAVYGGGYDPPCDALQFVRSACDHRFRCTIPVNDGVCPPGTTNIPLLASLRVTFRCGDSERIPHSGAADRPFLLRISCALAKP